MNYPDEWKIAVQGLRVRIDYRGQHYHTSAPFRPVRDREGIARPNPNAEALATLWRFAARCYGHPHADDHTPDPPISPEPEPVLNAKEQRFINRQRRGGAISLDNDEAHMAQTTRTLNPLPFEALEPRRFEDLIRQLAYDFRAWQSLEATGRTGSDDGFDARGWEAQPASGVVDVIEDDDESPEPPPSPENPRKWLIQCKRERRIGPAKMAQYVEGIDPEEAKSLYGIVFAAACDLSKKSRDEFRERCRDLGIAEVHIWAKGEIEDMLFQPKNDGLLFAYFNISLRIRQRTMKTAIRSRIAMKRKVKRLLGGPFNRLVLIRDPEEEKYPFIEPGKSRLDYNWRTGNYTEDDHNGIRIHIRTFHAYFDPDGIHWDAANAYDERDVIDRDPWLDREEGSQLRADIMEFMGNNLTPETAGRIEVIAILPYDKIVEIDEAGDELCACPHIYFPFRNRRIDCPVIAELVVAARLIDPDNPDAGFIDARRLDNPDVAHRVQVFPEKFRVALA